MAANKHALSVYFANHPRPEEIEQLFRDIATSVATDDELYEKLSVEKDSKKYDVILRGAVRKKYRSFIEDTDLSLTPEEEKIFFEDVLDEIKGLGPIEQLLRDPEVTEIMVNGPDCIFVEKNGINHLTPLKFIDSDHLIASIQEIVSPLNRRIDMTSPMIDARLPDGSRVNAVINPVALDGPYLTIRKFPEFRHTLENLIDLKSMNTEMAEFIRLAVRSRLNILISGGTGTGKTTMLNVFSDFISPEARIVIVEDIAELTMHKTRKNICRLEAKPANIDGKGEITIRNLIRNTLRMRPDRIVVGEVRGEEAFDLIQAMNTGHDGSLTTLHANSSQDALHRLEAMVVMAGTQLTLDSIRELISSGINLIVHLSRFRDGSRKIVEISAVGSLGSNGKISVIPIWIYAASPGEEEVSGKYHFHGIPADTRSRIEFYGFSLPQINSSI